MTTPDGDVADASPGATSSATKAIMMKSGV
jgi:hypothetical protein